MSADFAPDDEDDPFEGTGFESKDTESSDELDTTRVDIDPALFGELPDGPIEQIDREGNGLVSGKTQHEWEREAMIVDMIEACPYCDGEVSKTEMRSPSGDLIVRRHCRHCDEQWITNQTKGFTGSV